MDNYTYTIPVYELPKIKLSHACVEITAALTLKAIK